MTTIVSTPVGKSFAPVRTLPEEKRQEIIKKILEANGQSLEKTTTEKFESTQKQQPKKRSLIKGLASTFVTGLGQITDGRIKEGFKYLGKELGVALASTAVGIAGYLNFAKATQLGKTPYGFYAALITSIGLAGISIANKISSIKDAYKCGQ